ncbi:MAG: tetratricopeptide repeat protein [Pirellulaceae bacterium]|nr:tetratricopeptide repeat protein [Planctomycetales bacterium]MCA9264398.1 tetratricopeptide repeat protein [Planctomycetales bacterium]
MSQAPALASEQDKLAAYRSAWQATREMLQQGKSFSGHERNCAFLNCRGPRFANVSAISGLDFEDDGRTIGLVDWDQDGDIDMWLGNRSAPRLRLMLNDCESATRPLSNERSHNGYLAVRLHGTQSNRDAIGARVSVILAPRPPDATGNETGGLPEDDAEVMLIQTLRAGDGYLSQSSKWLHFGVEAGREIRRVSVLWPSGHVDDYFDVLANSRYELTEGDAAPKRSSGGQVGELAADVGLSQQAEPVVRRTYLSNRIPMPSIEYRDCKTSESRRLSWQDSPTLLTLWASWCPPCLAELSHWTDDAGALQASSVNIVALSLDGLDTAHDTQAADASRVLQRMRFPWPAGMATREILDKLAIVESLIFNQQPGVTLPASYLVDRHGQLAVVYHTSVSVEQLRQDLDQLDATPAQRRDLAVPLPGRWLHPPRQLLLRTVARAFRERGFEQDAAQYLKLDTAFLERQRNEVGSAEQQREWNRQFAMANVDLARTLIAANQHDDAQDYLTTALQAQPDYADAHLESGELCLRRGDVKGAIRHFRSAADSQPDSVSTRAKLAAALVADGDFAAAVSSLQFVAAAVPDQLEIRAQLARALLEVGKFEDAVPHLRVAAANEEDLASALALAWILATSPADELRDGPAALDICRRQQARLKTSHLVLIDVAAAAYAETGSYPTAVNMLETALRRLVQPDSDAARSLSQRLELYRQGRPYRDDDGRYP